MDLSLVPTKREAFVMVIQDGDPSAYRFESPDLSAAEQLLEVAEGLRGSAAAQIRVEVIVSG